MNRTPGFTLIELVVTVAIAGILLALAIPSFRETLLNNQRATRVNQLVTDLQYARSQALELRRSVVVCRSNTSQADSPTCASGSGWEEGWVVFSKTAGNTDASFETGDLVLRRQDRLISPAEILKANNAKFTIRGNGGIVNRVMFSNSGLSNGAGNLVACDLRNDFSKGRAVVIASTGRIRSVETNDSALAVTTCLR